MKRQKADPTAWRNTPAAHEKYKAQHRCGHELRCEVVHPERLENCKPGHGPDPTRREIRKVYNGASS